MSNEEIVAKEIDVLVNAIEERLPSDFKVLEGDEDSIYVKNRVTGNHYEIKIKECE